jgi:hypothetical protein
MCILPNSFTTIFTCSCVTLEASKSTKIEERIENFEIEKSKGILENIKQRAKRKNNQIFLMMYCTIFFFKSKWSS